MVKKNNAAKKAAANLEKHLNKKGVFCGSGYTKDGWQIFVWTDKKIECPDEWEGFIVNMRSIPKPRSGDGK